MIYYNIVLYIYNTLIYIHALNTIDYEQSEEAVGCTIQFFLSSKGVYTLSEMISDFKA